MNRSTLDEQHTSHAFTGADLARLFRQPGRPWVGLRLDEHAEIISVPTGAAIMLTAPSGGGKTSLAVQVAWTHALHYGPVVYVSREMDAEELAARIVAQRCGVSWGAALKREIDPTNADWALDLDRLRVLEHGAACLATMEQHVMELREQFPSEPVLVVIDYLQIMPREGGRGDERTQVASVVESVRAMSKRLGVVTLALSQSSRAGARALASGERIGAETTDAGAETAQIERAAHATLALGTMQEGADGARTLDLSIGKNRMGDGDRVLPVTFDGATGLFRVNGAPQSAKALRTQRSEDTIADDVIELVTRNPGITRDALVTSTGKRRSNVLAVVKREVAAGRIEDREGKLHPAVSSHS